MGFVRPIPVLRLMAERTRLYQPGQRPAPIPEINQAGGAAPKRASPFFRSAPTGQGVVGPRPKMVVAHNHSAFWLEIFIDAQAIDLMSHRPRMLIPLSAFFAQYPAGQWITAEPPRGCAKIAAINLRDMSVVRKSFAVFGEHCGDPNRVVDTKATTSETHFRLYASAPFNWRSGSKQRTNLDQGSPDQPFLAGIEGRPKSGL